ncbi:MAG: NADH-quinone oxidoreductase subunit NuoG [candidate division Zixibacteria bacterium]|nr:NADH-quinone oxidoreductase subunit NuoG [candidate division Zixibacteria bacterium]
MAEAVKEKIMAVATVTCTIDGHQITVPKGTSVFDAAKQIGIVIPAFCNHAKLKPVGACRMCYVEIEKMPKLQVSCATMATDGMVVSTNSQQVREGRKAVIEFTLINHPLDCPTCDKGGECDLQDLTFSHGYDDSRFGFDKMRFIEEEKRATFDDLKIGPEIVLNRNRCILCYKCVRANKEAFGEYDIGAFERGDLTEINATPGGEVSNPFSGNLVEICPVGALTNSDWRYKIRVWLTKTVPSICNFSGSGTNITFYKEDHKNFLFRVTARCNDDIDDGWLSDITRYGYQIVNSKSRLKTPLIKKGGKQVAASWDEALAVIKKHMGEIKDQSGGVCIGGLISPSLDNASLYSFSKLFRTIFKSNNIDFRGDYRYLPSVTDSPFTIAASQPFSIAELEKSDVIITFGTDLIREHHNEYLKIRRAVNFYEATVYSVNPYAVKTADIAKSEMVYSPGTDELVINGVCLVAIEKKLVDSSAAARLKSNISKLSLGEIAKQTGLSREQFVELAEAISSAKKISFIVGEIVARSLDRDKICAALSNLNKLFGIQDKGQLAVLARYANSKGAQKLGISAIPYEIVKKELKKIWGEYPDCQPRNTDSMINLMKKEEIKGFITVGANPMRLYPDRSFASEGLEHVDFLVACDMFETETTELADVVLPLCSWAEYDGDYINLEGKVQTGKQAIKPKHESKAAFEIMELIARQFGAKLFENEQNKNEEIEKLLKLDSILPWPDDFLKIEYEKKSSQDGYPIPLFIGDDPHHSGHLTEKSPSLLNFTDSAYVELSKDLAAKIGVADGDPVRVESPVGKIVVPAKISPVLNSDVAIIPRNFSSTQTTSLLMRKKRVDSVKLTRVEE